MTLPIINLDTILEEQSVPAATLSGLARPTVGQVYSSASLGRCRSWVASNAPPAYIPVAICNSEELKNDYVEFFPRNDLLGRGNESIALRQQCVISVILSELRPKEPEAGLLLHNAVRKRDALAKMEGDWECVREAVKRTRYTSFTDRSDMK
ncbi:hypothetical protein BC629DRAFT_1658210 [Irpex lacteus]|nr:hypothetical protein BC629DRAFT_1658210 [Irpex lacteus]